MPIYALNLRATSDRQLSNSKKEPASEPPGGTWQYCQGGEH